MSAKQIEPICGCVELQSLYLQNNQIGAAGAAALADALRVNGALTTLFLGSNQIGEDSKSKLRTNVMRF